MTTTREFKVLDDREHVLLRPGMYLGQTSITTKDMWLFHKVDNKFYYKTVSYVPALLKYISEIIDNSVDVAIDTNFKYGNKIQVNITKTSLEVIDNGVGIPCTSIENEVSTNKLDTCVVAAWTKLKSGTSFSEGRKKIGTNGVGASCCNIFSKLFIGTSDDGTYKQTITCTDNMSKIKASSINKSTGKSGVRVYCEPDLERFGLVEITDIHCQLVYQRLLCLALSYPKITFTFNGEKIKIDNKKLAMMFSDSAELVSSTNTTIIIFPNEYDEFKSFSLVNGIETYRGGEHVDYVTKLITNGMRDKLVKKYKEIRPGDIKTKLCITLILTDFENPQFDAQTKESLANPIGDISKHINNNIDFDKLIKNILKNEEIINPIIDTFRIKQELKTKSELNKVKKIKVSTDKYMPPIGKNKTYLALCEGLSARSGISASLGRDGIGYYAMRGLPLNAYSSSMQKIVSNQELKDIINILNLDISDKTTTKTIDFDKVLITSDADADGDRIASILIGWFKRFAPNLFDEGKICRLITPVIMITNNKDQLEHFFFSVAEFKVWEAKNQNYKGKITYLKGLGSHDKETLIELFDKYGLDYFIETYTLDSAGEILIKDWLDDDALPRKKYLRDFKFDINNV